MSLNPLKQIKLFDAFPAAVYVCDRGGLVTYFNQRALTLWGKVPDPNNPEDLFCPFCKAYSLDGNYVSRDQGLMAQAITHGRVVKDMRVVLERLDGSRIVAQVNISPFKDENDHIIGAINIFQDITEQYNLERSLKQANEDLKWNTEELEQLTYCTSHDLREPLRTASMYIQLLSRKYKDQLDLEALDYIATAAKNCERARELLNDLLTYNRVRGKYSAFGMMDLNESLEKALMALKAEIISKGAVIIRDDLPLVYGDENKISLVFQNLIGNALKFCTRAPKIHIFGKANDDEITIGIRDNGIGIDSIYKTKIFEIFQRLHSDDDYPGSGLGLAVCKKILEQHRGSICFDSKVGRGTVFYIRLPAKQQPAIQQTAMPILARSASEELLTTSSQGRHIMQVYTAPNAYLENVVNFIATGVEKEEGVLVLATQPHWQDFQRLLARKGFDVEKIVGQGRIRFLDAELVRQELLHQGREAFQENFTAMVLDLILSIRQEFTQFRAFGELVDVFCAHGEMDLAIEAEKVWDQFVKKYDFVLFCAYCAGHFKNNANQSLIVDICQNHSHLLPAS